jgi:tetratricopeptide (TPR) repeat protein
VRIVYRPVIVLGFVLAASARTAMAQDEACHSLHFRTNFRLNGASQHIAQADGASYADTKVRMANDALRALNESVQIGASSGADPFTTWFLFGRAYLILGDLPGADSSLTKAAALAPTDPPCQEEIKRLRKNAWIPLQQAAVGQIQTQSYDSALVLLRRANLIYRDDPGGYLNMAAAFLSQQKDDSATVAFRMAVHAGNDPARADLRSSAALNAARLLARNHQLMAAESVYREYVAMKPHDMAARSALATVLSSQHRPAEAAAVYDSILSNADSLDSFQLFDTGASLFNLAVADSARADSAQRRSFFQRSARAFEASAHKNPFYRDALYNLAASYLAGGDQANAVQTGKRLVAIDSLNQASWQRLGDAYRDVALSYNRQDSILRARRDSLPLAAQYAVTARAYRDSTLQAFTRRDAIPLHIAINRFDPRDSTAGLRGAVRNVQAREHPGFILAIEFLNAQGEVVATERVDVPALNAVGSPGQSYDFDLHVSGRGIIAYRYKVT